VPLDHRLGQVAVRFLLLVDLIVGEELLKRLRQQHLVTELRGFGPLTAFDQFRVLFEQAEHPLGGRNGFAVELGPLGDGHHRLHRGQIGLQLQRRGHLTSASNSSGKTVVRVERSEPHRKNSREKWWDSLPSTHL
jgi:hypothetical protein